MMTSEAYLQRLGLDSLPDVSVDSLKARHRAHVERIPYDNLSIQLDRPDDGFRVGVPQGDRRATP